MKNTLDEQEKLIQSKQKDFQNASIFVTKNAVNKLKGVMKSDNKENYFLRMSVEGGGCSGMTYKMDFDKKQKEFDKVSSCSAIRGYQYIYNNSAPEGKVWPVQYRSCSLKEGASHQAVRDLYDRAAQQWSDDGLKGGGRLFYQQLGSVEHDWNNYTQVVSTGSFANEAVNRALLDELDYSGINAEWAELVDCTPYVLYAGSYLTKPLD